MQKINKHHLFSTIAFALISFVVIYNSFKTLGDGEFLFIGDHFLRFSFFETALNAFFVRRLESLGANNAWQFIVQFWDAVAFLGLYKLGLSILIAEKAIFFFSLFFSFVFAYTGFVWLSKIFFENSKYSESSLPVFAITAWYVLNPYTFTLWHGGVYNLGLLFTYGLLPITFSLLYKAVFGKKDIILVLALSVLLFLSSFAFWLFAACIFSILMFFALYLVLNPSFLHRINLSNVLILLLAYVPMSSFVIFNMYFGFINLEGYENPFTSPTFSNQQGGMWYQALMYFSWAIYTKWTPRILYSFDYYFFSGPYLVSVVSMYLVLIVTSIYLLRTRVIADKSTGFPVTKTIVLLSCMVILSIFFAKGGQPPFGNLFMFLYDAFPPFRVFRSADARFGLCVVFAVSLFFLYISRVLNKYVLTSYLVLCVLIQTFIFLNGVALRGQNLAEGFIDRVVEIPSDYRNLALYINAQEFDGYILSLPPMYYGQFRYRVEDTHIGQDMLPKLIHKPFLHTSMSTTGLYRDSYEFIVKALNSPSLEGLQKLPVQYILIRRDILCTSDCYENTVPRMLSSPDKFRKVFENNTFTLYHIQASSKIVEGTVQSYQLVNPTKLLVTPTLSTQQNIVLNLSYSKYWKIFRSENSTLCNSKSSFTDCIDLFNLADIRYIFEKPISNAEFLKFNGFANQWKFSSPSADESYVIFFLPQAYFYLSLLVSFSTLLLVFSVLTCVILYRVHKKYYVTPISAR